MTLFRQGYFTLHSGDKSRIKIECDALSNSDWDTIAIQVADRFKFGRVVGVPRGGMPFALALLPYVDESSDVTLIVDDVLTTGASMEVEHARCRGRTIGVVLFARGQCPEWVYPIFKMWRHPHMKKEF